jgi:hypothetical protein
VARRVPVGGARRGGDGRLEVEDDADLGALALAPDHRHRPAVGQEHVVGRGQRGRPVLHPRGVLAELMAQQADAPGLVVGDEAGDSVAQLAGHHRGIVHEGFGGRARGPAPFVLQGLGQVPVIERGERRDPVLEQHVHEPAVEVEAGRVHASSSLRQHARPGQGEAVGLDPEVAHQCYVVAEAVVVVAGHVPAAPVEDGAGLLAEAIPDRLAAAVDRNRTFDLVGRGGRAPHEAGREREVRGRGGVDGSGGRSHGGAFRP